MDIGRRPGLFARRRRRALPRCAFRREAFRAAQGTETASEKDIDGRGLARGIIHAPFPVDYILKAAHADRQQHVQLGAVSHLGGVCPDRSAHERAQLADEFLALPVQPASRAAFEDEANAYS